MKISKSGGKMTKEVANRIQRQMQCHWKGNQDRISIQVRVSGLRAHRPQRIAISKE